MEEVIGKVMMRESTDSNKNVSVKDTVDRVWDVDEPDRFAKLALNYPELLTHDEEVLWKLIRENGALWHGRYDPALDERWVWPVETASLNLDRLREHWETFKKVAKGDSPPDLLPKWPKRMPPIPKSDEIVDDVSPY